MPTYPLNAQPAGGRPNGAIAPQPGANPAPKVRIATPALDPFALIEFRRGLVRKKEFRPLGVVLQIHFERNDLAQVADASPIEKRKLMQLLMLDWLNQGPLLGQSNDDQMFLLCSRVVHPPELPDPAWVNPGGVHHWEDGRGNVVSGDRPGAMPVGHTPARVAQRLRDRNPQVSVNPKAPTEKWLVFPPITQVLFRAPGGIGVLRYVNKHTGNHNTDTSGNHATLMYCPEREEAHILYGCADFDLLKA